MLKDGGTTKDFTPAQITTDATGLGTLVSVPLTLTIDTGGSHFGVFLPAVQLTLGQTAPVTTTGVIESFQRAGQLPAPPDHLAVHPPDRQGRGGDRAAHHPPDRAELTRRGRSTRPTARPTCSPEKTQRKISSL